MREPPFDDGPLGARAHPVGVGAGPTQQVQPGDHHGLTGAGFPGQYRQTPVELGRGDADGAQRLDPDLTEHRSTVTVRASR